jgi:serine/threonine protein kinase
MKGSPSASTLASTAASTSTSRTSICYSEHSESTNLCTSLCIGSVVGALGRLMRRAIVSADHSMETENVSPRRRLTAAPTLLGLSRSSQNTTPGLVLKEKYVLKSILSGGHGGTKLVNAVRNLDGKQVVIKFISKLSFFADSSEETEWRKSMDALLDMPASPNIVQLVEVLEDTQRFYVVMDKIDGCDLHAFLMQKKTLSVQLVKSIMRQILLGVACLHKNGLIHRDLKLENVMIENQTERVLLIDFDDVRTCRQSIFRDCRVKGTDQYIAPEAYAGQCSSASDMFAVGVICYTLLAGSYPFDPNMFDDKPGENISGSPKMEKIRRRVELERIDWNVKAFTSTAAVRSFAMALLSKRSVDRLTATQALKHSWLQ